MELDQRNIFLITLSWILSSFLSVTILLDLPDDLRGPNAHLSHGSQELSDIGTVSPVRKGWRRMLEAHQVHLDSKVLDQQLAGHPAYRVVCVIWIRMSCAWKQVQLELIILEQFDITSQEKITEDISINLLHLVFLFPFHQKSHFQKTEPSLKQVKT